MSQKSAKPKKDQSSEVILIDEEEPKKKYKLPGVPERILKKQRISQTGELKYLVKWKGYSKEDATWESEEVMKDQFNELIEDYEFYNLTGERFDEALLENKRKQRESRKQINLIQQQENRQPSQQQQSQNESETDKKNNGSTKERDRERSRDKQRDKERERDPSKGKKKAFKKPGKPMISYMREKNRNDDNNEQLQKSFSENENTLISQNKSSVNAALADFNKEEMNNAVRCQATSSDKIDRMELKMINGNDYVFEIGWKKRNDGVQPYSDFFQYTVLSQIAPALIVQFLECYLLGSEQNQISFYGPPENTLEGRINILRKMRKLLDPYEQQNFDQKDQNQLVDGEANFQVQLDLQQDTHIQDFVNQILNVQAAGNSENQYPQPEEQIVQDQEEPTKNKIQLEDAQQQQEIIQTMIEQKLNKQLKRLEEKYGLEENVEPNQIMDDDKNQEITAKEDKNSSNAQQPTAKENNAVNNENQNVGLAEEIDKSYEVNELVNNEQEVPQSDDLNIVIGAGEQQQA